MNELANLFPNRKGINDSVLHFHTVTAFLSYSQPKGIFIPLYMIQVNYKKQSQMVQLPTLWEYDKALPNYIPNHFSVFLANDLWKGLEDMLESIIMKLS